MTIKHLGIAEGAVDTTNISKATLESFADVTTVTSLLKAADITTAGNLNAVTDFGPSGGSYAFTDTTNTYLVVNAPTATQPTGDGNFDNGEIIIEIVGTPDGTIKCYLRGWRLCRCLTPTPPFHTKPKRAEVTNPDLGTFYFFAPSLSSPRPSHLSGILPADKTAQSLPPLGEHTKGAGGVQPVQFPKRETPKISVTRRHPRP